MKSRIATTDRAPGGESWALATAGAMTALWQMFGESGDELPQFALFLVVLLVLLRTLPRRAVNPLLLGAITDALGPPDPDLLSIDDPRPFYIEMYCLTDRGTGSEPICVGQSWADARRSRFGTKCPSAL